MTSLYAAAVTTPVRMLRALDSWLTKLAAHCEATKVDEAVFLNARLFPDMLPFTRQVQIVCDFAKFAAARLAVVDAPSFPDTEASISELKARIANTLAFVEAQDQAAIDAADARIISFKAGPNDMSLPGEAYVNAYFQPNFFFHLTIGYAILRHNGLAIGKLDFLGMR